MRLMRTSSHVEGHDAGFKCYRDSSPTEGLRVDSLRERRHTFAMHSKETRRLSFWFWVVITAVAAWFWPSGLRLIGR